MAKYGFKPSDAAPSRSERARLRNMKRGVISDDEDEEDNDDLENNDMRDDAIAEKMENALMSDISNSELDEKEFNNHQPN